MFYTLVGRVEPAALAAVSNEWLHAQHGALPAAIALDGKATSFNWTPKFNDRRRP